MILSDKTILKISSFFTQLISTFLSLVKILLWTRPVKLPKLKIDKCIILGNGPSLKLNLENDLEILSNSQLICVNLFPLSPYYLILKPKILVLCDPQFWENKISDDKSVTINNLFYSILEKTEWELNLFIPVKSRKNKSLIVPLKKHPFIKLYFYNTSPIEGFDVFKNFAFKHNLGMPRPRNVLISSIYISILLKFKYIILLGADHSWIEDIFVDVENRVMFKQKHFYDKNVEPKPFKLYGKSAKMHELMLEFYRVFYSYQELDSFSKNQKTVVVNSTPDSFIDAFIKQPLGKSK